jgi:hypothetical protein
VGRIANVAKIANRMCAFNLNPPKVKLASGNKDDRLSLSRMMYSMQQACINYMKLLSTNRYSLRLSLYSFAMSNMK